MSDLALQKQPNTANRQTDEKLLKSLEMIRQSKQVMERNAKSFHRNLALSFQAPDQVLSDYHEQIIQLFFQTIPAQTSLSITISVAPSSNRQSFKSLQKAWERLRKLEQQVSKYSSRSPMEIELVYQPELAPDTATLQVIGG